MQISFEAPRCYALVPCAGIGARAGAAGPKQYELVAGRSVVAHTLAALAAVPRLAGTLVVLAPDDTQFEQAAPGYPGWVARVGGPSRAASVAAGLVALRMKGETVTELAAAAALHEPLEPGGLAGGDRVGEPHRHRGAGDHGLGD
ncbi:2-C-methyl-D-erythritol 4-phosphate cytidylyltransferase, partial [Caldimonas sp.]|uniref:2-C-methyl-D-erythritol 4-phosphate cytidylyltransferase n=1 Tax=Caldimonas sp. TaxID=2838790 RepID=UPI00391CD416